MRDILANRAFFEATLSNFFFFSGQNGFVLLPLYVKQLGGSEVEIGVVMGVYSAVGIVVQPLLGPWIDALRNVARADNVVIKISAVGGSADPGWTVESIRPWVLGCIEAFGTDRAMFASNWPVDSLFGTYEGLLAAYADIVSGFSDDERTALFSANTERFYGI